MVFWSYLGSKRILAPSRFHLCQHCHQNCVTLTASPIFSAQYPSAHFFIIIGIYADHCHNCHDNCHGHQYYHNDHDDCHQTYVSMPALTTSSTQAPLHSSLCQSHLQNRLRIVSKFFLTLFSPSLPDSPQYFPFDSLSPLPPHFTAVYTPPPPFTLSFATHSLNTESPSELRHRLFNVHQMIN